MRMLKIHASTLENIKRFFWVLLLIAVLAFLEDALANETTSIPNERIAIQPDIIQSAIQERNRGNFHKSISLLQQGLNENPNSLRMKIEMASSYFSIGNYSEALTLAQEVAASDSLPPVVRSNVNRFIKRVKNAEQHKARRSFSRQHTVSIHSGYDSNANIAPEDAQLDIGDLPITFLETADGFYGYSYSLSQQKNFYPKHKEQGNNRSLFQLYSGFTAFKKEYDDIDSSDLLLVNGTIGTKYISDNKWYLKTKASLTYVGLGHEGLLDYYRLASQVGYFYRESEFSFNLEGSYRDYQDANNEGKTGVNIEPTLKFTHNISKNIDFSLSLGSSYSDLKNESLSYNSNRYKISTTFKLPINAYLNLGSRYSKSSYDDVQQYYLSKREDKTYRHHVKVDFLNVFKGFDSQLSYTYVDRKSNNDINSYTRDIWLITFKYQLGV